MNDLKAFLDVSAMALHPALHFQPTSTIAAKHADAMLKRLHHQSKCRPGCGRCLCCEATNEVADDGDGEIEADHVGGEPEQHWDELTKRHIPHRMSPDKARHNIQHTTEKPFCYLTEAKTAALVGKEGCMAWLSGCKAAEAAMRVSVRTFAVSPATVFAEMSTGA